jgi:hypothetical protein
MTSNEIEQIVALARKGAKIMIGRDHTGRNKIKIKHGLFGLQTKRVSCEPSEMEMLKRRLSEMNIA